MSDRESRAVIRSLGLALLFNGVAALKPLAQFAVRDVGGGFAPWIPPVAMFAAGCALAFSARRWALPAAIAYLLAEVAAWRWADSGSAEFAPQAALMEFGAGSPEPVLQLVLRLLWPAVVLAAVWLARRAYARPASRRAEAGGALAALGLAPLLWTALYAAALGVSMTGDESGGEIAIWFVILGFELAVSWLALRAGHRLIIGAARPPLTALLLVMTAEVVAVVVVSLFGPLAGLATFKQIALICVGTAIPLLMPLCLRAYARRAGPLEQPAPPDSAAAAGPVAWLVLWCAIQHIVQGVEGVHARDHVPIVIEGVRAAAYLAVFAVWLRGSARGTMWTAAILGAAELGLFVVGAILSDDAAMHVFLTGARVMADCAPLLLLAWLHRPRARREVGVEAVFE